MAKNGLRTLVLIVLLAAAANAQAAPLGSLLPGSCVTRTGESGACARGVGLDAATAVAISPDGAHVYAAGASDDAVTAFARDPDDGRLEQLPGSQGCSTETGSAGLCADGTALDGAAAVAVSPDGRHVYVASRSSNAVAAFARDTTSGRLEQLPGTAGCVSETGSGGLCADGSALRYATGVTVSPDGATVYLASRTSDAVAVFARDAASGTLVQLPGGAGCMAEGGAGGCTPARGLDGASAVAVDPAGAHVYAAARYGDAVAAFDRDAASGALSQLPAADGCASRTGTSGCAAAPGLDGATGLAFDPGGRHLHVAAANANALAVLERDAATGALASLGCVSRTPNDAGRGTIGCFRVSNLWYPEGVAVAADGRSVHVAARDSDAVTTFAREPSSGRVAELYGSAVCVGASAPCARASGLLDPVAVAAAPDGRQVYAASAWSDGVVALGRSTASGPPTCSAGGVDAVAGATATLTLACEDPTDDALGYIVDAAPAHGSLGSVDPSGHVSFTPDASFRGTDVLRFHGTDGAEASASVELRIAVKAPASPPTLPLPLPPGPPPAPSPGRRTSSLRTTFLLSRAADGGFPDGPSRNAAVSHDQRIARVMAYEADATNIVPGDGNGTTDVFIVRRQGPWGPDGTDWTPGPAELASTGVDGEPANGPSYLPALDGDSHHAPRCVAFVSRASNLVPGDTNGQPDAFVRDLQTGHIRRVSVDSRGRQADGPTTEVAVDGACERVAFVAAAPRLALTSTSRAAWRPARTSRPRRGTRQVYVRVLGGGRHERGFAGLTFLASASAAGRAGNGDSLEVAFARDGKSVAFASEATNLARGDGSRRLDVYRRAFPRRFRHLGRGRGVQTLRPSTTLVSRTPRGRAGSGASRHPSITDIGDYVAYETLASDLLPGDRNGVSDIARADLRRGRVRQAWVSRSRHVGDPGNGPSNRPVISGAGEFVLFDSEATNLKPSEHVRDDVNGVRDVFLWNAPTGNVSLESRDADNGYLSLPSSSPSTSSRGNYVPFESANPLIDLPLAERAVASAASSADASRFALQQVYLRYLGPK